MRYYYGIWPSRTNKSMLKYQLCFADDINYTLSVAILILHFFFFFFFFEAKIFNLEIMSMSFSLSESIISN